MGDDKKMEAFKINPSDPFYKFNELCKGVKETIDKVDFSLFVINGDGYSKNTKKRLLDLMSRDSNLCLNSPPELLKEFAAKIVEIYDNCNAWEGLSMWPPRIIEPSEEAKVATFILVDLLSTLRTSAAARNWVTFFTLYCVPEKCRTNKHFTSKILKACCVCHRKRKVFSEKRNFWATLDANNHFQLFLIEDGQLKMNTDKDIDKVMLSRSGKTVKLFKDGELVKRIIPLDTTQNENWMRATQKQIFRAKFPQFLSNFDQPVPDLVLFALNEALLSEDYFCLRALTNYSVISVSKALPLEEALFDIFAYAGKVNDLIMTLSSVEFSVPELKTNTVLRGNSHLTNMFKVFFKRFGKKYYDKFLREIILFIDSKGDLKIKTPEEGNLAEIKTMIFTVLQRITDSIKFVPPEIRHFASVLKTCASQRFNTKQATYNTLSGFFFLRYLSPTLSNPLETDPELKLVNPWLKVLVPTAQFIIQLFNLIEMEDKYEAFSSWNEELRETIFPNLIDFAFSVAVADQVQYKPPTKERLRESLITVLSFIGESETKFSEFYNELSNKSAIGSPLGHNLAAFISSFFEQNSSA